MAMSKQNDKKKWKLARYFQTALSKISILGFLVLEFNEPLLQKLQNVLYVMPVQL